MVFTAISQEVFMETPEQRTVRKRAERIRRQEARIAQGLSKWPPRSEKQSAYDREYMRKRRADGLVETWAKDNPDRHRENIRKWRANNLERAREINREMQAIRRSTPWGKINNRIWAIMHGRVRRNSSNASKYTAALGYLWSDLRSHLEAQFTPEMTWENWGDVWQVDHIKPVSSFQYTSLDDPLFREAWKLSNLRPLPSLENLVKGKTAQCG
jgi:hypothetical protein